LQQEIQKKLDQSKKLRDFLDNDNKLLWDLKNIIIKVEKATKAVEVTNLRE